MKIQLRQIPPSGRSWEVEIKPARIRERFADRADIVRLGRCQADVYCERVEHVVTLRGRASLETVFVCSRCAEEVEATLRIPLKQVLMPRSHRSGPADDDEGIGYHNGREIDLAKIVADQVALVMPNVLLCDPDCRGLCPVCGAISLMPGTGSNPAFRRVDVDTKAGKVTGLF